MLLFIVIDPYHPKISTKYVPFQQKEIMKNYLIQVLNGQIIDQVIGIIVEYLPCWDLKTAKLCRNELISEYY